MVLAARGQFWGHGYHATTMADLCAATGLASQSLYGAFGSKHGLFVRTLEEYCDDQVLGLRAGLASAASPWAWLLAAVGFDDGGRTELTADGCYLSGSTSALARLDADVDAASQRTYASILDLFGEAAEAAQARGEIRSDTASEQVALSLLTAMQGIEFLRRTSLDEATFARAKASVVKSLELAYAATDRA